MFTLKIETGNAAFAEDAGAEIMRILGGLVGDVQELRDLPDHGALRDVNGNTVGTWRYVPEVE